jgi:hypothetical protein
MPVEVRREDSPTIGWVEVEGASVFLAFFGPVRSVEEEGENKEDEIDEQHQEEEKEENEEGYSLGIPPWEEFSSIVWHVGFQPTDMGSKSIMTTQRGCSQTRTALFPPVYELGAFFLAVAEAGVDDSEFRWF